MFDKNEFFPVSGKIMSLHNSYEGSLSVNFDTITLLKKHHITRLFHGYHVKLMNALSQ